MGGVAVTAAPDLSTVGGTLLAAAERFGDREAPVYDGRRATHEELLAQAIERARAPTRLIA